MQLNLLHEPMPCVTLSWKHIGENNKMTFNYLSTGGSVMEKKIVKESHKSLRCWHSVDDMFWNAGLKLKQQTNRSVMNAKCLLWKPEFRWVLRVQWISQLVVPSSFFRSQVMKWWVSKATSKINCGDIAGIPEHEMIEIHLSIIFCWKAQVNPNKECQLKTSLLLSHCSI